jgi:hypothetical protein
MGYIKHNTIIVTGEQGKEIEEVHQKAKEIFKKYNSYFFEPDKLISEIINGLANGYVSFFIAPDGSKERWEISNECDDARDEFINWLIHNENNECDYVEVRFGGDDDRNRIIRSKDIES